MRRHQRRIENQVRVPWEAQWPLILYFFLTLIIAASVFLLVDQNSFNTTSRRPSLPQADGTVAFVPYMSLQSDVTTLLSLSLTVLRFVGVLSVGTITWRCIYFLMEKEEGIPLEDVKWILASGLPTRSLGTQKAAVALVAAILLTTFPSQFSSPILTGSITWDPSTYSVQGLKPVTGIPLATQGVAWTDYRTYTAIVNVVAQQAAGLASAAWGNTNNSTFNSMARAMPTIQHLPTGTELANVTAPYFAIDKVEWVQDVAATVTHSQIDRVLSGNKFIQNNAEGPLFALIPDSEWGPEMANTTFPRPSIRSETRTLVILLDHLHSNTTCLHTTSYCGEISPKIGLYTSHYVAGTTNCYAFARVTYHAGAAVCHRCQLSNRFVFSNTTVLELQEDVMTTEALALMFLVSHSMVFGNSLPSPINNIDNFVTEGLSRSYQASWSALHQKFRSSSSSLSTDVTISVPSSRANVQKWRIGVWVVINIMYTFSAVISFIAIREPVIIDVAIAAMLLETDDVIRNHPQQLGDLTIVEEEDQNLRLHLKYKDGHPLLTVMPFEQV